MEGPSPRILVVDDDAGFRAFMRVTLEADGFAVSEAPDGEAGAALARRRPPDLILLDWRLPDTPGIEILRRLREEHELDDVRIAMVTGLDDPRDRKLARQAGADAFVVKTGDSEALASEVRRLVGPRDRVAG
jgi:DNA-binding response OmpR family regulator